MRDWLELELAEELRPAPAPDELWERVRGAVQGGHPGGKIAARSTRPVAVRQWPAWPIAAILTVAVAAATLWLVAKGQDPGLDLRQMAMVESRNQSQLELNSSDPAEINQWMRRETGLDPAIPERNGAHLTGARVIRKGDSCVGVVSFKVGGDTATLLVARGAATNDHAHGRNSWQAQGVTFAVATASEHSEAACLLCHMAL